MAPLSTNVRKVAPVEAAVEVQAKAVCEHIAEGHSLREACRLSGLEITKFLRLLTSEGRDGPTTQHYMRARETRADARFERMDEIIEDLRIGVIQADQARVMIDAIKWQTGKEHSKRYGDKVEVEQTGEVSHTIKFTRG